jgi:hypothetical protein
MATFKAYPNGVTMGVGNAQPVGGMRGEVVGWSSAAVRRHKRWLYSVERQGLSGQGDAVTLTMRHTPATVEEWQRILRLLFYGLRDRGMIRWHWVVEWQRRGTPHLHLAVYSDDTERPPGPEVVRAWLRLTREYGSQPSGQHVTPITGPVGWLKYLSKHASRGVKHYQRQGKPAGWEKTGRLWGYGGVWPVSMPVEGVLTTRQYHQFRRLVRRYAVAEARSSALRYRRLGEVKKAESAWKSVGYLRRMLKCHDRNLSTVRGVSDWAPPEVTLPMALWVGWQGEAVERPLTSSESSKSHQERGASGAILETSKAIRQEWKAKHDGR